MSDDAPFALMNGEELMIVARPHPLAMLGLMLFWLALGAAGLGFLVYSPEIEAKLIAAVHVDFIARHAYDLAWFGAVLLPLVIMAVFRINFGYVLTLLLLVAGNVAIQWKLEPWLGVKDSGMENILLMAVGLIGVIGVEIFRRGHRYYVTTHRIVARFGSLRVSERSTLYSKIDDLMLQKTILGRILNFGTVIPVTSAGLGMGQDLALAGAGAGGGKGPVNAGLFVAGGKAKNVPRELSIYVLYRISNPDKARNLILEEMSARERPRRRPRDEDTE